MSTPKPAILTKGWFRNRNQSTFEKFVLPKYGGVKIFYLEIGVFEGASLRWMLENVLTHPESRAIGIDPWLSEPPKRDQIMMEEICARALQNVEYFGSMVKLHRGMSSNLLPDLTPYLLNKVDLCMIDGDHNKDPCLQDAYDVWPLLKVGGGLIFDDYVNRVPKKNHVKDAVKLFREDKGNQLELWYEDNCQIAFLKK